MDPEIDPLDKALAEQQAADAAAAAAEKTPTEDDAAAQAAAAQAAAQAAEVKRQESMVPLGALQEERQKRQEIQQQITVMRAQWDALMAGLQQKSEAATTPQIPDREADPLGYLDAQTTLANERLARMEKLMGQSSETQRVLQEQQAYTAKIAHDEMAFAQQNPGYKEAATFVVNQRLAQLEAMGLSHPEIQAVMAQEAFVISRRAEAAGKSAPAAMYEMAQKLGWKAGQPRASDGTFAPKGVPLGAPEAPTSLGEASSTPSGGGLSSRQDLSKLSDAEFDKLFQKMAGGNA